MPDNQVFTNPSKIHIVQCHSSSKFKQIFFQNQKFFGVIIWQVSSLVGEDVSRDAEDSLAGYGAGRPSNKTPVLATCWSRHSIKVENIDRFLFAYFCEASIVNTACGNSLASKVQSLDIIGGRQAAGEREPDRRLQLVPQHTAGGRLHQSRGFIGRFSRLIPTVNCAVTSDLVQNGVL